MIAAEKVHPFVNWATAVDLKTGVPSKLASASTHQDYNAKNICPTNIGAKGISPAAYSPKTGLIYVPLSLTCMTYESVESRYKTGQPWVGAMVLQYSWLEGAYNPQVPFGLLSAFSPLTNKVIWYQRENYSPYSGILVTSSNLVFHGTLDRWFKALDAKTGKELWKFQASSGVVGNTFSYSNNGKQYMGIMTGIGGWPNVSMRVQNIREDCGFGCPHGPFGYLVEHNSLPGGGALNIFSL